jgi:hypothetical protein
MKDTLSKYCTQGNKGEADMARRYSDHNERRTENRRRPSGKSLSTTGLAARF